eukprot:gene36762-45353_t
MGSGYLCLALCLAEISSALPFSGGTYGLARLSPRKFFWKVMTTLGFIVLVLTVVYCALSPIHGNFDRYALNQPDIRPPHEEFSGYRFFVYLPAASWFFRGVETLPLTAGDASQASKSIPKAIYAVFATSFLLAIGVLFSSVSLSPGITREFVDSIAPLTAGYGLIFHIRYKYALVFTLITQYARAQAFLFVYSRQLLALEKSRLYLEDLPSCVRNTHELLPGISFGTTLTAIITPILYYTFHEKYTAMYNNACQLACYFVYIGMFACYYQFRKQFHTLSKGYRSPFGIYGAIYGTIVFSICAVSLIGFQDDNGTSITIFVIMIVGLMLRYIVVGRFREIFNSEEQAVMFIAYVMKTNAERRKRTQMRKSIMTSISPTSQLRSMLSQEESLMSALSAAEGDGKIGSGAATGGDAIDIVSADLEPLLTDVPTAAAAAAAIADGMNAEKTAAQCDEASQLEDCRTPVAPSSQEPNKTT